MNNITYLGIGLAVVAVIFAVLWRMGAIARFTAYVNETTEELKKCTWPTWDELRAHTAGVIIMMLLIGVYTVGVDFVIALIVQALNKVVV